MPPGSVSCAIVTVPTIVWPKDMGVSTETDEKVECESVLGFLVE